MAARLDGKIALISGVSDGIGGAIARCFASEGASVVCSGKQLDAVEAIAADIRTKGGQALALELDVTVAETSIEDFRRIHDVNVGGVAGNGGSIINISSVAASSRVG